MAIGPGATGRNDVTGWRLRPLTGADELTLDPALPFAGVRLLAELSPTGDVDGLAVDVADRLLARLYSELYGDRCDCRARCWSCREAYGFELSLRALIEAQDAERPEPDPEGGWRLAGGSRVRAPRVGEVQGDADDLASHLVLEGRPAAADVWALLERAAPVLALDLDARCPHCGAARAVRFDLARYLVDRLHGERPLLLREVHLIAARYGWSLAEILGLSRADRRAFAGLVEAERTSATARRAS